MFTSFRNLFGYSLLLLVGMTTAVQAQLTPQEVAAQHALNGPEIKKLKVAGHEFNVKKATVTADARQTVLKGQVSHHLSFRPDDQIYYTIVKSGGKVISIDINIDRGGLAPYASRLAAFVIGKDLADGDFKALLQNLGQRVDGRWESAADLIIATIALKAPDSSVTRTLPTPRPRPSGGVLRDHRIGQTTGTPTVRDHRTKPVVRDHRN